MRVCAKLYKASFPMLGQRVAASVQSIMGSGLPRTVYSSTAHNFNPIPRKPKGKSKRALAMDKHAPRACKKGKSSDVFQRKLIVFQYMGENAPKHFTRRKDKVLMRGMLPDISIAATEEEVRKEICTVIRNCVQSNLAACQPNDFQFIDMSGKHACVPAVKPGMSFTGKATKQLAGSGCLYVRLTRDIDLENPDSDDSNSMAVGEGGEISDADITLVKVEAPPTSLSTLFPHLPACEIRPYFTPLVHKSKEYQPAPAKFHLNLSTMTRHNHQQVEFSK